MELRSGLAVLTFTFLSVLVYFLELGALMLRLGSFFHFLPRRQLSIVSALAVSIAIYRISWASNFANFLELHSSIS